MNLNNIGNNIFIRIHYFRAYGEFEANNEFDDTLIGNKTTIIFKQNTVLNGYYIKSEVNDVLKSGYYQSPLGYDNIY